MKASEARKKAKSAGAVKKMAEVAAKRKAILEQKRLYEKRLYESGYDIGADSDFPFCEVLDKIKVAVKNGKDGCVIRERNYGNVPSAKVSQYFLGQYTAFAERLIKLG